jgi:hypothetical protein
MWRPLPARCALRCWAASALSAVAAAHRYFSWLLGRCARLHKGSPPPLQLWIGYHRAMSSGIVAKRGANALITDAQATLPSRTPNLHQVEATLGRFKSAHGGLWVGGRATLTTQSLCFRPNAVNRAIQTGSLDIELPLPDIVSIEVLPAFVSSVIAIRTPQSAVKIRCFRADAFARLIAQLAGVDLLKAAGGRFRMRLSGD